MTWKPDICIYHFPCDDGFAAAWCVWKKWGDTVEMRPSNYGQPVPDHDVKGKRVLIADFSFKTEVLEDMCKQAHSIVILDHHKTAKADLEQWNWNRSNSDLSMLDCETITDWPALNEMENAYPIFAWFDMDKSGASLTWEFCFQGDPQPELIKHIEDRDLWRMQYPETRALSLFLRAHEYDFGTWDRIMETVQTESGFHGVLAEAKAIEKFYDRKISDMADTAVFKTIGLHEGVAVAYAPYAFASDLAHELLQRHADAPFTAVVVDAYGGRTYSLRSDDDRVDVSEVAKSFGGGGHRNAAGFRMPA